MNIFKSDSISLHGAVNSMTGGRPENQDDFDFLDTPLGFLCIICDGMGGGPGGKTASYIAKYEIGLALRQCNPATPREIALKMAVAKANEVMEAKMREVPSINGMGSTIVAILIDKDSALIAHAGDSRCYQIRGKKCIYRSKDHSLVAQLVERKALTEEEARVSPQANVITRGLGSVSDHVPEIDVVSYKKGDRFILCTDGVWGSMPHKDLLHLFYQNISVQDLVVCLSQEVDRLGFSRGGTHDNHTIAIIEMGLNSLYKAKYNKKWIFIISLLSLISILAVTLLLIYISSSSKTNNKKSQAAVLLPQADADGNKRTNYYSNNTEEESVLIDGKEKDSLKRAIEERLSQSTDQDRKDSSKFAKANTKTDSTNISTEISEAQNVALQIIEEYKKARDLAEPTGEQAKSEAYKLQKKVIESLKMLHKLTRGNAVQQEVERIKHYADPEKNWWTYNQPNDKGKFTLMKENITIAEQQIERLDSIKEKLQ